MQAADIAQAVSEMGKELQHLRKVEAWALRNLGIDYEVGDRVTLVGTIDFEEAYGWAHYRECLVPGATGVITEIQFNEFSNAGKGAWQAAFMPDREWSIGEWGGKVRRYWNGKAEDTPPGYEPPSKFDQETYPEGRHHHFWMGLRMFKKAD